MVKALKGPWGLEEGKGAWGQGSMQGNGPGHGIYTIAKYFGVVQ